MCNEQVQGETCIITSPTTPTTQNASTTISDALSCIGDGCGIAAYVAASVSLFLFFISVLAVTIVLVCVTLKKKNPKHRGKVLDENSAGKISVANCKGMHDSFKRLEVNVALYSNNLMMHLIFSEYPHNVICRM